MAFWLSLCLQRLLPMWVLDPAPANGLGKQGKMAQAPPMWGPGGSSSHSGANQLTGDFLSSRSLSLSLCNKQILKEERKEPGRVPGMTRSTGTGVRAVGEDGGHSETGPSAL